MKKLYIDKTIKARSGASYSEIARLHQEIKDSPELELELSLTSNLIIGQVFLFHISNLPFVASKYGKYICIHCCQKLKNRFIIAGFLSKNCRNLPENIDMSPYFTEKAYRITHGESDVVRSLVTNVPREAGVEMSERLSEMFTSQLGEMFINATEHSQARHILGAKYVRNARTIYCFSCYDTGVGIPQKVMAAVPTIKNHKEALVWAMKLGNSSVAQENASIPRGLGLGLLHEFTRANNGAIRIATGKIYYEYTSNKKVGFHELSHDFIGTLYEIDIVAEDNHKYIIK